MRHEIVILVVYRRLSVVCSLLSLTSYVTYLSISEPLLSLMSYVTYLSISEPLLSLISYVTYVICHCCHMSLTYRYPSPCSPAPWVLLCLTLTPIPSPARPQLKAVCSRH